MQIVDPETNEVINLYSDRINQLLEKYDEKELLALKITTPLQYNRQTVFVNDILYTIMLNLNINDIKSLCQTDKHAKEICHNKVFWEAILKRDGLYLEGVEKSLASYELLYSNKLKIDRLKLKNSAFRHNIDLLKVMSPTEINKVDKEWEDYGNVQYEVKGFDIYKGFHNDLILSLNFETGYAMEITIDVEPMKDILFKTLYYYPNTLIENY